MDKAKRSSRSSLLRPRTGALRCVVHVMHWAVKTGKSRQRDAKVVQALKNLYKVKADSPALVNFIALVKWVDPASAEKIVKDIGMAG